MYIYWVHVVFGVSSPIVASLNPSKTVCFGLFVQTRSLKLSYASYEVCGDQQWVCVRSVWGLYETWVLYFCLGPPFSTTTAESEMGKDHDLWSWSTRSPLVILIFWGVKITSGDLFKWSWSLIFDLQFFKITFHFYTCKLWAIWWITHTSIWSVTTGWLGRLIPSFCSHQNSVSTKIFVRFYYWLWWKRIYKWYQAYLNWLVHWLLDSMTISGQ